MVAQIDRPYFAARPSRSVPRMLSYLMFEGRPLLTKGRWINPLLHGFHGGLCRLPAPKRSVTNAFIVGTGRSGTTILGKVLSLHRDIGFLNEPKAMWHKLNEHDDLIGSYSTRPGRLCLDASEEMRVRARRLFSWYASLVQANCILDKYPEMIFRVEYLRTIFPDARFIFLVRNGWETANSIEKWSRTHREASNGDVTDWWGRDSRKWRALVTEVASRDARFSNQVDALLSLSDQPSRAAVEWMLAMSEGQRVFAGDDAAIKVSYEAMTEAPAATIRSITQFLGLPPDETVESYAEETLMPGTTGSTVELDPMVMAEFSLALADLGYS